MKTSKRYVHRIVIPVVSVGIVAIIVSLTFRLTEDDPPPQTEITNAARGSDYLENIDKQPYSQELVTAEAQKLQRSLASIQSITNIEEITDEDQAANLEELRNNVEAKIAALRKSNEDNWDERQYAAQEALRKYSEAVGKDVANQPNS